MNQAEREVEGIVFDVDRFAVHDGPGLRTTVFLKGCPLRCVWCHSPDSVRPTPQLVYRESRCVGCARCVSACPLGAQRHPSSALTDAPDRSARHRVLFEQCDDCGLCVPGCLGQALSIWGRRVTAGEIVDLIGRQKVTYRQSGGGVTLSGGEPTFQLEFARAVLRGCREDGVPTALETCGLAPWSAFESLDPIVDLYLFDLKHLDSARHRELTGAPNETILENFARLVGRGADVVARVPLIPGLNDDVENVAGTADFVRSVGGRVISLLPYNAASAARYDWIGQEFLLGDRTPQSDQQLEGLARLVRAQGLEVRIGF